MANIVFVDLDGTLRKTKSGKPYPIYRTDWVPIPEVIEFVKVLSHRGYLVIFVTNQSQIGKSAKQLDTFEFNLKDIISKLPFKVFHVFVAPTRDSEYRKPKIDAVKRDLSRMKLNISKDSVMIGDAGGREGDFASSDFDFAMNLGINFVHVNDIL